MKPWTRKPGIWPWREFLTAVEAAEIAAIDDQITELSAKRAALSARRSPIQNRALQRAKFAAGRTALAETEGGGDAE